MKMFFDWFITLVHGAVVAFVLGVSLYWLIHTYGRGNLDITHIIGWGAIVLAYLIIFAVGVGNRFASFKKIRSKPTFRRTLISLAAILLAIILYAFH